MSFETHNTSRFPIRVGQATFDYVILVADYNTICKYFGQPLDSDGHKIDAQWIIRFANGDIATIYNYKNGKAYLGESGPDVSKNKVWHIDGSSEESISRVKTLLSDPWPVFDEIRQAAILN